MKDNDKIITNTPKTYENFHLEDQHLEPTKSISEQTIIDDFAGSKDTYFILSSSQLAKLKLVLETIFRLTNETLLDTIKQKDLEPWIESRYGVVKSL